MGLGPIIFKGKVLQVGGKVATSDYCCPVQCGSCWFFKWARVTLSWSFSVDPGAEDLNGSGEVWDLDGFPDQFAINHAGSGTSEVIDTTKLFSDGVVGFGLTVPDGSGGTFQVTAYRSCTDNGWGFTINGPGNGINITHGNDPLAISNPANNLGLVPGSCGGATLTNAIFSYLVGGIDYAITGSFTITVINNGCP